MTALQKKYGFFTAVSMVVGIVIGSGVFKSAGSVLGAAGGDMKIAILAWLIGGIIMIASAYSFSLISARLPRITGVVDYMELVAGKKMGYMVEWFMTIIYYPSLVSILSWLAASITVNLLGFSDSVNSIYVWICTLLYLFGTFGLSLLSPILAGKWQVSATVIKLIPLLLIAIAGLSVGLFKGSLVDSMTGIAPQAVSGSLVQAVAITVFAYDGWILATSISSELKNPKRNVPLALLFGSIIVVIAYIVFFIGLSGVISNQEAIDLSGSLDISVLAAKRLFGTIIGSSVSVLILISVLGTLNGLIMATLRGMYTISAKEKGPYPQQFQKISKHDVPYNSLIVGLIASLFWISIWYGNFNGWFNGFMDTSILSIVFLYLFYILVYVYIIRKMKDLHIFNRFVVPVIASIGALYLVYGAFTSDQKMFFYYVVIVAIIMLLGFLTYDQRVKKGSKKR